MNSYVERTGRYGNVMMSNVDRSCGRIDLTRFTNGVVEIQYASPWRSNICAVKKIGFLTEHPGGNIGDAMLLRDAEIACSHPLLARPGTAFLL